MPDAAPWWSSVALVAVGVVAGALNVVAGGGSFLTIPVLIFMGLPPTVANATNRVGVFLQNVSGVWGFHRHAVLDWRWALWAGAPATAGAAVGALAALVVGDEAFRRILALVMVVATLGPLLMGDARLADPTRPRALPVVATGFFFAGVYGGFLQAGVGFIILALTSMAGLDLVRGNAVKVLAVLLLTALSLVIFQAHGSIDWPLGLALGLGNFLGGFLGVRLAVTKGHRWLKRVVSVAIVAFALRLWFG